MVFFVQLLKERKKGEIAKYLRTKLFQSVQVLREIKEDQLKMKFNLAGPNRLTGKAGNLTELLFQCKNNPVNKEKFHSYFTSVTVHLPVLKIIMRS